MQLEIQNSYHSAVRRISYALYLYLFFLLFEGALRRWVLPGLSGPLLLVRDPIAAYILLVSWRFRILKMNIYLLVIILITFISFYTALLFGHGNLFIALFGTRITLLHFPLIFVIPSVFNLTDIYRLAKWMTLLCIPMLFLTVLQFYSTQTSWINKALGDSLEGGGFVGAKGYFRPPGTFSFTNGLVIYFTMCSSFIFWGLIHPIKLPKWLIYISMTCLLLSIPFSISRSLLFSILITFLFYLSITLKSSLKFLRFFIWSILISILIYFMADSDFLGTGLEVFMERFNTANETEGGLQSVFLDRFLGGLVSALISAGDYPFWGYGVGIGTNVGSMLATGKINFLISEGEWGRILGELGPVLGLLFVLIRIILSINMVRWSFQEFKKGYFLPWLMIGNIVFYIAQGQWAQPTSLGFSVFFGGVLLASLKLSKEDQIPEPTSAEE